MIASWEGGQDCIMGGHILRSAPCPDEVAALVPAPVVAAGRRVIGQVVPAPPPPPPPGHSKSTHQLIQNTPARI